MTKLTITFRDGRPSDIDIDGKIVPVDAFLLVTNVPTSPPAGHTIAYGSSDTIGQLLMNFYLNTLKHDPFGAHTVEQVARDIISQATRTRGAAWYATDEGVTN